MPRLSQGTRAGQQRQDLAPSVPPPSRPSAVLPPQARGEAEILTPSEVLALLNQISTTSSIGLRNRALITVLYRAGLRHAEALALFPKDVDLAAGSIAVLHGKGDRRRTVGIDPGGCGVIRVWSERRRQLSFGAAVPLFCTLQGGPMKASHLKELLPRLARQADIQKRVHAHGLRHTHAYELMMEGVEIPVIQRQLGHVSLATPASISTASRRGR
jgi:site-specific recombinase XerD